MKVLVSVAGVILVTAVAAQSVLACGVQPSTAPVPTTDLHGGTAAGDSESKQVVQPTQPVVVEFSPTPVPAVLPDRAMPSTTQSEVKELVEGNSAFAFDLYRTLSTEDGNLFFELVSNDASIDVKRVFQVFGRASG